MTVFCWRALGFPTLNHNIPTITRLLIMLLPTLLVVFLVAIATKSVGSTSPMVDLLRGIFSRPQLSDNHPITIRPDVSPEEAETDFLLQKVMSLRQQVESYKLALDDLGTLSEKLSILNQELVKNNTILKLSVAQQREENQRLVAQLSHWSSRQHQSLHKKTILRESFAALRAFATELEVKVHTLEDDKEALQRSLDLLPLLCLIINVIVLVIAGREHFGLSAFYQHSWLFQRGSFAFLANSASSRMNLFNSFVSAQLQTVSMYATDAYRKAFSVISHLIIIMA
jgi:hypothetical protein